MAVGWKYGVESQEGRSKQDCVDLVISLLDGFGWIDSVLTIILFYPKKQPSLLKCFS